MVKRPAILCAAFVLLWGASAGAAPPLCADLPHSFLGEDAYPRIDWGAFFGRTCGGSGERTDTAARVARMNATLSAMTGMPCRVEGADRSLCSGEAFSMNVRCQCVDPDGAREFGATVNCVERACGEVCEPEKNPRCRNPAVLGPLQPSEVPDRYLTTPPLKDEMQDENTRLFIGRFTREGAGVTFDGGARILSLEPGGCEGYLKTAPHEYPACVSLVAAITGRAEDCLVLKKRFPFEPHHVAQCAGRLATARGNARACFYLDRKDPLGSDPGPKELSFSYCVTQALARHPTKESCALLERTLDGDPRNADFCYSFLGPVTKDMKDCDRAISRLARNACIAGIAKATRTPDLCGEMIGSWNNPTMDCAQQAGAPPGYVPKLKVRAPYTVAELESMPPAPVSTGAQPIRVAMSGNYWPLHLTVGTRRFGLEAEIAETLGEELGRPVQYLGREELGVGSLDAVAQGKADLAISSITPTDERRKLVDFTRPYTFIPYALLQPVTDTPVSRLEELAAKKVAVPKGPARTELEPALGGAIVVEVDSLPKAIQLLRKKKVNFVAAESLGLVELMDGAKERLAPVTLGRSPLAIAVPKGSAATWDAALKRIEPAIKEFEALYRPGVEVSSVVLKPCDGDEVYARVENGSIADARQPPSVDWFTVDWMLAGAPDARKHALSEGESSPLLCASAPVRVGQAKPKELAKAIRQATAILRGEFEGPDETPDRQTRVIHKGRFVEVQQEIPGVLKLAGGVRLTALHWTLQQQCVETEILDTHDDSETFGEFRTWSCPARGFLFVLIGLNGHSSYHWLVTDKARDDLMDAPIVR